MFSSVLILVAAVSTAMLPAWFSRRAADRRPAVFALAAVGDSERARRQAQEAVIAFGEELENAPPDDDLDHALDAYQAASMALDCATSLADLAGVLVVVNLGRRRPPLCFFNPLHGASVRQVTWRLIGTRDQLHVPACTACIQAVSRRRPPEVVADMVHGRRVPYLEVDAALSVWAATGYGIIADDLVARILRGDLHHHRKAGG